MHFASVKPSAERLYTFLNMEEERSGSKRVEKEISPILEFKNVRFQYTKDREVLKKVSFKLEPGEKVAIIGKNGSGKSTILELLLRFYEPEEGEILCNGENIKVLKLSEYRSLFSVVSQKSALFLGDIVQNIDLEGKADRQKLNEVLRKSGVKKYLQRFPEKEKTQIGDDILLLLNETVLRLKYSVLVEPQIFKKNSMLHQIAPSCRKRKRVSGTKMVGK